MQRLNAIYHSYRSLPLWVQIWVVAILMPVNAAAFFLLDTWLGVAAAIAAVFVVITNAPIMWATGGMSRLMSVPHLFAWFPLQVLIVMRLLETVGPGPVSVAEWWFGVILFVINGISLVFDTVDSWRWLNGERDVPGADAWSASS
ncbi:MAG: hypothetical protein ACX94A_13295 [Algiphilus sp.]